MRPPFGAESLHRFRFGFEFNGAAVVVAHGYARSDLYGICRTARRGRLD